MGGGTTQGLLTNVDTKFSTVLLFNVLMGFGVNILTYTSTMSGINDSLIESAQLDGANAVQEFWYIVLPLIYPTITTLMVVEFSHVFTNQYHLYTLFGGAGNEVSSVGYFLYVQAQGSSLAASEISGNYLSYSILSAMGLILTAIVLPTTLVLRRLLEKHGPSAD
jgi:ABC-type sugar transport system permease subunit